MIKYWSNNSSQSGNAENMELKLHLVQNGNVTDINIFMTEFTSNYSSLITVIKASILELIVMNIILEFRQRKNW